MAHNDIQQLGISLLVLLVLATQHVYVLLLNFVGMAGQTCTAWQLAFVCLEQAAV